MDTTTGSSFGVFATLNRATAGCFLPARVVEPQLKLSLTSAGLLCTDRIQCSTEGKVKLLLCDARHQLLSKDHSEVFDAIKHMIL